ncbi:MAG: sel1 repeat family protein [Campylobacteraceae bacterium]|jgi:TPR repeat protein|nr:sel1 repeat family protein [Campylobacteraceae bacterium]
MKKIFGILAAAFMCGTFVAADEVVVFDAFAKADDFMEAYDAHEKGDYEKAIELYTKSCDGKNPHSCNNLGILYEHSPKQDYQKALKSYKKACNMDNALGCINLGFMHEDGKGIAKSSDKAFEYFNKACGLKSQLGCDNYERLKK